MLTSCVNSPPVVRRVCLSCVTTEIVIHACRNDVTDAPNDVTVTTSVNLTEKNPKWHNKVTKSHKVGKRLFSGFLVSFASGVVEWNCWMKQQSNTQKQGALTTIQTGCLCVLHWSQSLTALNSWGMLVFNKEYYLESYVMRKRFACHMPRLQSWFTRVAMTSRSEHDDVINAMRTRWEHDDVMPTSSPCDVNHNDVVFL